MPPNTPPAATQSKNLTTHIQEESLAVSFDVQFWGVRDQIATPGKETVRYGGNTSCVEMRVGNKRLIFDGGTGLRKLGNSLLSQMPVEAHLFFTHCHWDRIQGFPFFVPAFIPINHFHIYGAAASDGASFKQRLSGQMLGPNFPVPIQVMQSKLEFYELEAEEKQCLGEDVVIESSILDDRYRSVGYRINAKGKSVVYATIKDYTNPSTNTNLLNLAHKADLLIVAAPTDGYIANPDPENLEPENNPWQVSVKTAKEANVKQAIVTLHSPDRDDQFLDEIERKMQTIFPNTLLAKEGMIVSVTS